MVLCAEIADLESAPEVALFEDVDVETCDDAEVVGAPFQGFEEVRVGFGVDIDEAAVGVGELVVDYVIACKTWVPISLGVLETRFKKAIPFLGEK